MKILVFLHGTIIMHENAAGKTRRERVQQVLDRDASIRVYERYVPVENAAAKLRAWSSQGAELCYLSSHKSAEAVDKDRSVLRKYDFPTGDILYRRSGENYAQVAERILPDVLIEDDCESIGGETEMTHPHIHPDLRARIASIVVSEFGGIDHLPDDIARLVEHIPNS
ncbi:MAG: hypothetical protein LC121_06560 [Anaerolineae bacterium]|nr:hypothetical protein [Anaerolineae bacterium]